MSGNDVLKYYYQARANIVINWPEKELNTLTQDLLHKKSIVLAGNMIEKEGKWTELVEFVKG